MGTKRRPAKDVAEERGDQEFWIDHAEVIDSDREWLADARWLTLWNVTLPPGFLASLPHLGAVDLRGGSATDLSALDGCQHLRCLVVNQVRGLTDLSVLLQLTGLVVLELYGLRNVTAVPSLVNHVALRRVELGLLRGLPSLGGVLDAPSIEELVLVKRMNLTEDDIARIEASTISAFEWWGEDTPVSMWEPVVDRLGLPTPPHGTSSQALARLG